jgi:hypothetical protein
VKILFLLDEAPSITCESQQFHSPFYPIKPQVFINPLIVLGTTDEALVGRNMDKLSKVLDLYEERLCNKKYSGWKFLQPVDLHHLPHLQYLDDSLGKGHLLYSRNHIRATIFALVGRYLFSPYLEKSFLGHETAFPG